MLEEIVQFLFLQMRRWVELALLLVICKACLAIPAPDPEFGDHHHGDHGEGHNHHHEEGHHEDHGDSADQRYV